MTTLYRPVLIKSAEQAEALPVGTIAVLWDGPHVIQHATLTSARRGPWGMDMHGYEHHLFIGWTALVPTEAEQETHNDSGLGGCETEQDFVDFLDGKRAHTRTRLVTPWEEA